MKFVNYERQTEMTRTGALSGTAGDCTAAVELAQLVFDSNETPYRDGLRGSSGVARQLLYKAGSICIDMRMQPTPGSNAVVLVGQLLNSSRPDHGIGEIPVTLISKGDAISQKRTNRFGEFDFGADALEDAQLIFGLGTRQNIIVPVPDTPVEVNA